MVERTHQNKNKRAGLIPDRLVSSINPRYRLIRQWSKWLRIPPIHCESPTFWQEFDIYIEIRNRRKFIGIGNLPRKPQRICESPLREAMRYQKLLGDPFIKSQLDIARELGITRARVSQVMALLNLAPEIQRELLALQDQKAIRFFSERRLRPLLTIKDPYLRR